MSAKKPHVFRRTVPDRVVELGPGKMRVQYEPGEFVEAVVASSITRIAWDRGVVASGGTAALDVAAWGLAPGRRCVIELTDETGRALATLTRPASKVGGAWQVSDAELRLTWASTSEHASRVIVPPEITKKAHGSISARVRLPDVGISFLSQRLRVGPRVAVRAVKILAPGENRVLTEIPDEGTVRIQAQLDVWPKEDLAGQRATVRLFEADAFGVPGAASLMQEIPGTVIGPPGRQGVEVLWQPTVERVAQIAGPEAARRYYGSQREQDALIRETGLAYGPYAGAHLFAEVELWGAAGRSTDAGSRGGSGTLAVLDTLDVQVVLGGSAGGEVPSPLSEATVEIELPDGTPRTVRLGEDGCAYLDGVPPGVCYLKLPALPWQHSPKEKGEASSDADAAQRTEKTVRLAPGDAAPEVQLVTGVPLRLHLDVPLPGGSI